MLPILLAIIVSIWGIRRGSVGNVSRNVFHIGFYACVLICLFLASGQSLVSARRYGRNGQIILVVAHQ